MVKRKSVFMRNILLYQIVAFFTKGKLRIIKLEDFSVSGRPTNDLPSKRDITTAADFT